MLLADAFMKLKRSVTRLGPGDWPKNKKYQSKSTYFLTYMTSKFSVCLTIESSEEFRCLLINKMLFINAEQRRLTLTPANVFRVLQ